MAPEVIEKKIQSQLLILIGLSTIAITPWWNIDAVNLPKFAILVFGGFVLLGQVTFGGYLRKPDNRTERFFISFLLLFFVSIFITLIFSKAGIWAQLFGTFGRNTGFLTYVSLIIISISIAICSTLEFLKKILKFLLGMGVLLTLYGLLQIFNLDPISWENDFSPIIGTFGNPNFMSAFLAISSIAALSLAMKEGQTARTRTLIYIQILLAMSLIYMSDSIQGLLVFSVCGLLMSIAKLLHQQTYLQAVRVFSILIISLFLLGWATIEKNYFH